MPMFINDHLKPQSEDDHKNLLAALMDSLDALHEKIDRLFGVTSPQPPAEEIGKILRGEPDLLIEGKPPKGGKA